MKCLALFVYSFFIAGPETVLVERWVIEKNSNVSIEGKSNVNNFRCVISEYFNPDTIYLYRSNAQDGKPFTVKGGLKININKFDCHQHYVTADLKKTLKANENPIMKVNLLTLGYIKPGIQKQIIKGHVEIQLAGVTKRVEIDYAVLINQSGSLQLTGTRQLMFSDFKLTPPRKLAGMIKVEEEIKVQFNLFLRYVP